MAAMPGWRRVELLSGGILTRRRHRHLGGPAASQQQHHSPGEALAHRSPVRRLHARRPECGTVRYPR
jgi:hypothetical protein